MDSPELPLPTCPSFCLIQIAPEPTVDASERLAALLAGELDADERIALEAELARDPELRADRDAMERADAHLAELGSPEPSAGFEQRLDDRMATVLDEVLGSAERQPRTGSSDLGSSAEGFTARRRDRASRRTQAMIGLAAAAVVLAGSGVLLTSFGGGDDAEMADDAEMFSTTDDAGGDTAGTEEAADAEAFDVAGPVVVAEGRTLDDDDLDELLAGGELEVVAAQRYDEDLGRDVAGRFQAELGVHAPQDAAADQDLDHDDDGALEDAPEPESAEDDRAPVAPELLTRGGAPLPAADAADLTRCLDEVLAAEPGAIPAYAELATYQGEEALALGLVTLDPETAAFTRSELWVLDRATCQLLRFAQS